MQESRSLGSLRSFGMTNLFGTESMSPEPNKLWCGSSVRKTRGLSGGYCCSVAVAFAVRFLRASGEVKDQDSVTAGPAEAWTEPAAILVFLPTMTSKLLCVLGAKAGENCKVTVWVPLTPEGAKVTRVTDPEVSA